MATPAQPPGQHPGPPPRAAARGVGMGATPNNGTNETTGDEEAKQRDRLSAQDHPPHACELLARRVDREDDGTTGMKRQGRTMKQWGRETK